MWEGEEKEEKVKFILGKTRTVYLLSVQISPDSSLIVPGAESGPFFRLTHL